MVDADDPSPVPHARDLVEVGREVMPRVPHPPPGTGRAVLAWWVRMMVVGVAVVGAVVALPEARFAGHGTPSLLDIVLTALLVGSAGAIQAPLWRALVGPVAGPGFGFTVWVLDLAILRVVDVMLGARFDVGGTTSLLLASAIVAIPTAVQAVVADVVANPDRMSMPP